MWVNDLESQLYNDALNCSNAAMSVLAKLWPDRAL